MEKKTVFRIAGLVIVVALAFGVLYHWKAPVKKQAKILTRGGASSADFPADAPRFNGAFRTGTFGWRGSIPGLTIAAGETFVLTDITLIMPREAELSPTVVLAFYIAETSSGGGEPKFVGALNSMNNKYSFGTGLKFNSVPQISLTEGSWPAGTWVSYSGFKTFPPP